VAENQTRRVTFGRLAIASLVLALVVGPVLVQASPSNGPITGTVFRDFDADGVRDPREPGEAGIVVRAVGATGVSGSATTGADGTYSLDLGAGEFRLEFDIPTTSTWLTEGAHGADNGTSVQFVSGGSTANFAVQNPNDFCQANPRLVTTCFTSGDPLPYPSTAGDRASVKSFSYDATGQANDTIVNESSAKYTGATWGVAIDRATRDIFVASNVKRHAGLGPGGIDAIYRQPAGGGAPVVWFSGVVTDDTANPVPDNATRGLDTEGSPSYDAAVFPLVGTRGWGDIDVSEDGNSVYAVNLFNQRVYQIAKSGASGVALPDPNYPACANGVARPWGLGVQDGQVLLGVVCSAENGGTAADLTAQVLRFDVAAGTWGTPAFANPIPLNYTKGCANASTDPALGCNWNPWTNTWDETTFAPVPGYGDTSSRVSFPMPILSDIEVDDDGSLILAFMDRAGHMFGVNNFAPDTSSTLILTVDTGGDLLRAAPPAAPGGAYTLEAGGSVGRGAGLGGGTIDSGAGNGQGPGGGEFYRNDFFGDSYQETSAGAVALINGRGEVATTQRNPFDDFSAGIARFSNSNGADNGRLELRSNSTSPIGFGNANALGDLELMCDYAPIEIGDRVWIDTNGDGIQGPDEPSLAGVAVELFLDANSDGLPDGPAIASAITADDGTYYFSSAPGASTPSTIFGVTGLVPGAKVILKVPTSVAGVGVLTTADAGANDRIDSDAVPSTGYTGTITLGGPGQNDYSFDFGYVAPYSLGNKVWADVDNDGIFDASELGIPNVTVQLFRAGGTTVIASTNTDLDGSYVFTGLAPGDYEVAIVPPTTRYRSSTGVNGVATGPFEGAATPDPDTDIDSDDNGTTQPDGSIRSAPITLGASAEPTDEADDDSLTDDTPDNRANKSLDFGLYEPASLGDYVWNDTNRDGLQNEPAANGVNGVTVELFSPGADGLAGTADDVLVASTVTADDSAGNPGFYGFANLVPGDYFVSLPALTPGTLVTIAGMGGDDSLDSDVDPTTLRTDLISLDPGENDPTWDVGLYTPLVNVGDQVWLDSNNNGRVDAGEAGIDDVVVNLYLADGTTPVGTTTTNDAGFYRFTGLVPGDYIVEIIAPVGLVSSTGVNGQATGPFEGVLTPDPDTNVDDDDNGSTVSDGSIRSGVVTLAGGTEPEDDDDQDTPDAGVGESDVDGNTTVDFGLFRPATLGDYVWNDADGDGVQDDSEVGVNGVRLELFSPGADGVAGTSDDVLVASTVTTDGPDGPGFYEFTNLVPGDYFVSVPAGTTLTVVDEGDDDTVDSDADPVTRRTDLITLVAGENDSTVDVGVVTRTVNVGDLVWLDSNNNGRVDAGEAGIGDVVVRLFTADGVTLVSSTLTNGTGHYRFSGLVSGDYVVGIVPPVGLVSSTGVNGVGVGPFEGAATPDPDSNIDDDDNGTTDADGVVRSGVVSLSLGGEPVGDDDAGTPVGGVGELDADGNTTVDFGLFRPASLGDYVFNDADRDGVQGVSEVGVNGVRLELFSPGPDGVAGTGDDVPVAQTVTTDGPDGPGFYEFTNLIPGDYFVSVPAGTTLTVVDAGDDDSVDSDADPDTRRTGIVSLVAGENDDTVDVGVITALVNVGDQVWLDSNNNGRVDAGEAGIGDVVVNLYRADGTTLVATTTTNTAGYWRFTGLVPGDYVVEIVAPAGFVSSTGVNGQATGPFEGTATPDPDSNIDDDDNGTTQPDGSIRSGVITLAGGTEPEGDDDQDTPAAGAGETDTDGNTTLDFGLFRPATLGDYVWNDSNRDGIQNEPAANGVNGVTIELYSPGPDGIAGTPDDVLVATTVTTNDPDGNPGFYEFTNLVPGDYFVFVPALPDGTTPTTRGAGGDDATDSDLDPATRRSVIVTVGPGERTTTVDVGVFTPTVNLGDRVWSDINNNGIIDADETGLAGVVVNLYRADGTTLVATTTTNDTGHYRFTGPMPGDYIVEIVPPSGLVSSTGVSGSQTGPFEGAATPDPDSDVDGDDNGTTQPDGRIRSGIVTVAVGTEPLGDDDAGTPGAGMNERDSDGNTTLDFGLTTTGQTLPPGAPPVTPPVTPPGTPPGTPPVNPPPGAATPVTPTPPVVRQVPAPPRLPSTGSGAVDMLLLIGGGLILLGAAARRIRRV
jgi:protocatechuate 3,4-dioxygenase beta subunit